MRHRVQNDVKVPKAGPRDFLQQGGGGYPFEYILSRVRGRRSRLIRDWRALAYGAGPVEYLASSQYQGFVRERSLEGLWRSLQREYRWVFGQLDEAMRRTLAPYFLYAELRTITVSIRLLQGGKEQQLGDVLAESLLADELKAVLQSEDAAAAIAGLEEILIRLSAGFRGLSALYEERGLRELEQTLVNQYLTAVLERPLHPVVREFVRRIIDARNVLALYKSLRLSSRDASVFIPGGSITVERLKDLQERDDLFTVITLVRQAAGVSIAAPDPTQVEVALYRGVTKFLKQEGKDPLGTALILEYLWRCSLEVTNLSVLFSGKDLDRESAAAELVT
jgi:vacuolar-type H+-ATPase subunit C/Vma6